MKIKYNTEQNIGDKFVLKEYYDGKDYYNDVKCEILNIELVISKEGIYERGYACRLKCNNHPSKIWDDIIAKKFLNILPPKK